MASGPTEGRQYAYDGGPPAAAVEVCLFPLYRLFHVNTPKLIPRQMFTPFFSIEIVKISLTSSACPCEDLTCCCWFLFCFA